MHSRETQQKALVLLLTVVTLTFGLILWPFYSAVFWGIVLAILFRPLYRRLLGRVGRRHNLASFLTVLLCLVIVVLPVLLLAATLLQEAANVLESIQSKQLDFGLYFDRMVQALPASLVGMLERLGLAQLSGLQDKLAAGAGQVSQVVAKRAVAFGQDMLGLMLSFGLMLYLLFFLLRDGTLLVDRIKRAIPLEAGLKQQLFEKFATVIRATVKGNLVVAAAQGLLGAVIFAFLGIQAPLLWGVVMAMLSLLPMVGPGLVWLPVAIYLLLTGAIWQGVTLILFGALAIGLIDNFLRPILVGKDTRMPDYVVLFSTVGGLVLIGVNGFVIGPVIAAMFIVAWDLFTAESMSQPPDHEV